MDSPKYAAFDVSDVTYKVVNGQDIKAYILTPKNLVPGKHPIVVKFHGGFFVSKFHPTSLDDDPDFLQDHWQEPAP